MFARSEGKKRLGEIFDFYGGFSFKSNTYLKEGRYRILTIKNVQDGLIDTNGCACIDDLPPKLKTEQILSTGDVLLSLTGNVGRVGIVCEDNLLLNQRVAKVKASADKIPFIYFLLREPSVKKMMELISKGTAQANLSPIETLKLEIDYSHIVESGYKEILSTVFNKIVSNTCENKRLEDLRNTLLPKLISGELDVSKLEL